MNIPADFPVQPLAADDPAKGRATCGYCGLSWDDAKVTSMTPAPSARCPFEAFHIDDEPEVIVGCQGCGGYVMSDQTHCANCKLDSEQCAQCDRPSTWHDETTMACSDDPNEPHPDSELGLALDRADNEYGIQYDPEHADFDFIGAMVAKLDSLPNGVTFEDDGNATYSRAWLIARINEGHSLDAMLNSAAYCSAITPNPLKRGDKVRITRPHDAFEAHPNITGVVNAVHGHREAVIEYVEDDARTGIETLIRITDVEIIE